MVEYRLNEDGILVEVDSDSNTNFGIMDEIEKEQTIETFNAPVERGFWTKFKNFMFKEINLKEFLFQEIDLSLKLSPYEKKVFNICYVCVKLLFNNSYGTNHLSKR